MGSLLWSSASGIWLNASQTASLSRPVSSQHSGIVLVWRQYDDDSSSAIAGSAHYQFVPKSAVAKYPGMGTGVLLMSATANVMGCKYAYIHDDRIVGHNNNQATAYTTSSGITLDPRNWALTEVYGA